MLKTWLWQKFEFSPRIHNMIWFLFIPFLLFGISYEQVADKIWKNECNQSIAGLTTWKKGEDFASLGIGHFIWYPENKIDRYEETFPSLVLFLEKEGALAPAWTKGRCPWTSRDQFYAEINSPKMEELRDYLIATKGAQVKYIVERLDRTAKDFPKEVLPKYEALKKDDKGLFALIDYLNFKGSGLSGTERYQGEGWGLIQVLKDMNGISIEAFIESAKHRLILRVKNAPPERKEQQWLKGWINRVERYLEP